MIKISEIFYSISGEAQTCGSPAIFIRTFGCNLRCGYCDTAYSYDKAEYRKYNFEEILAEIKHFNCNLIVLTGGEPLYGDTEKRELALKLEQNGYYVSIETNGASPLLTERELQAYGLTNQSRKLNYVLDIKAPSSGMSDKDMFVQNVLFLRETDSIKCVISDLSDYAYCKKKLSKYAEHLKGKNITIYFSPVFGKIRLDVLAEIIKEDYGFFNSEMDAKLKLGFQLHKYIWNPNVRGV